MYNELANRSKLEREPDKPEDDEATVVLNRLRFRIAPIHPVIRRRHSNHKCLYREVSTGNGVKDSRRKEADFTCLDRELLLTNLDIQRAFQHDENLVTFAMIMLARIRP
ncbi:hypothetical protein BH24CHL2_BH24CHL2_8160 [soil metagenome]